MAAGTGGMQYFGSRNLPPAVLNKVNAALASVHMIALA